MVHARFITIVLSVSNGTTNGPDIANMSENSNVKPTAFFINCARGDLIVEDDLIRALDEGKLAGAAMDVFEQEPLPMDHPFITRENVVLTPHMGAATEDSVLRCTLTCCEEIVQVFNGEPVAFPAPKHN